MKRSVTFSLLFFLLVWITGCASTESTANDSNSESETELKQVRPDGAISDDEDYFRDLGDYLHRVPGVTISGQTAIIRGVNSFNSGIEPLFVVDGTVIGSSFAQANSMINVREIDYVKVLKGTDAAIYGVRGGNGVVLIVMKK